jgi:hypothetical protein
VFWAWDTVWNVAAPLFTAAKPLEYVISGVWLMPAVIAALIVRKPGAALFAELVAVVVSALLGKGQSALRVALAVGHPGELGDLGLHDRLGEHAHTLAQEVGIALGDRLAYRVEHGHPVCGHRGVPPCRRFLARRREDDAVAALVVGHRRCDTTVWDVTTPPRAGTMVSSLT